VGGLKRQSKGLIMKEKNWEQLIEKHLVGRKITSANYMPKKVSDKYYSWHKRPIELKLDNGVLLTISQDDEGNDGGAIHTNIKELPIIPTING
jgi:hypothetical protein